MSSVGERIKKIRGALTQKEFADSLGITAQAIINYERHGRIPSRSILNKISTIYTVAVDWLLTGEGSMYQKGGEQGVSEFKMGDTSPILEKGILQHTDFINTEKLKTGDTSPILRLMEQNAVFQRDLLEAVRQNGDLRVEVERLRMDVERRDARIAELERQLAEPQKLAAEFEADVARLNVENRELREKMRQFERMGLRLHRESDALQNRLSGGDD